MYRLRRYIPLLALCFATATQVLGTVANAAEALCVESCPNDDDTGHCPPSCLCACHGPQQPTKSQLKVSKLEVSVQRFLPVDASVPVSPDPKPLRHVPKNAA